MKGRSLCGQKENSEKNQQDVGFVYFFILEKPAEPDKWADAEHYVISTKPNRTG